MHGSDCIMSLIWLSCVFTNPPGHSHRTSGLEWNSEMDWTGAINGSQLKPEQHATRFPWIDHTWFCSCLEADICKIEPKFIVATVFLDGHERQFGYDEWIDR